jgi:HEAT repeat protein
MPRQSRWTRPHLARTLRTDADPRVRARAVTALSRSAGEAALGILLQARWDDSHQVRVRVREALARMEIT